MPNGRRSPREVRCICLTCGTHSFRQFKVDDVDAANSGWGQCRRLHDGTACGGQLTPKRTLMQERKDARAKAELAALARGERV